MKENGSCTTLFYMDKKRLLQQISSALRQVHGQRLKKVVLYGSIARGDAKPDSDIDVMVVLDRVDNYSTDLRTNIEALYTIAEKTGRRISAKPVGLKEYEERDCPLFRHAHAEGIAA